jgi:hypothetical protein
MPLIINMRRPARIGKALLMKATSCKAKQTSEKFKALCDNDNFPCRGEYYLHKKWAAVIMMKPKYINIMSGLITDEDERARDNKENHFDDGSDNNWQAFFLAHHQLLVYHWGLSFHPQEAALFQQFEICKLEHLFLDYDKSV